MLTNFSEDSIYLENTCDGFFFLKIKSYFIGFRLKTVLKCQKAFYSKWRTSFN